VQIPGKPESEQILRRSFTGGGGIANSPDFQVRMKASGKTRKNKKIRRKPGRFQSKRFFGGIRAHAAFDEDYLLGGELKGEFLQRLFCPKTPAWQEFFQRRVFLRQGRHYQNLHPGLGAD